jgi:hypothetical protein
MRLYSFANMYLSPLQMGLQTGHCISRMSVAYNYDTEEYATYAEWANNHETIIICNGGNSASLAGLREQLAHYGTLYKLPTISFNEDEQSLNGALTATAIVVPEHFYDVEYRAVGLADGTTSEWYEHTNETGKITCYGTHHADSTPSPEFSFIKLLKSYRLA